MLWQKGWLETRLRLSFSVAITSLLFYLVPWRQHSAANPILLISVPTFMVVFCAMLAGAGIATQPPFQATKGLHGSMLYTLSLPVSRLRLLVVRAVTGWLEMGGVIAILCAGMWLASPALRSTVVPAELFEYALTLIACASSIYFLSVLLATFLEDQWRIWGTMLAAFGWWWLTHRLSLPASTDIFQAMSKGSPIFTQTMPWTAMAFSLALSAIFFVAALKVVQSREY
jgi:hypothetical protein